MSLKEKIQADIKNAMKAKDANRVSVLRMLMASISNKEKEKRAKLSKNEQDPEKLGELSQLTEEEITEVIVSETKKRKDSIEQYGQANRDDLVQQEQKEMEILMEYMPEQMDEEAVRKIIKGKISELGAEGSRDMGKVMGAIMPQLKGKADGGMVNKIVQEELKG